MLEKESNGLEEVEAGLVHSAQNVYTEYADPRRDEWQTKIAPARKSVSLPILQQMSGLSRRTVIYARNGKHRPHKKNQKLLKTIL
jgi:hypothetical protein